MCDFLIKEGICAKMYIAKSNGPRRHPVSKLYVQGNRRCKISFLENVIPHLIIKKERAKILLEYLRSLPISNTQHYPEEQARRCKKAAMDYLNGSGFKQVCREQNLAQTTLARFMKTNGVPRRSISDSLKLAFAHQGQEKKKAKAAKATARAAQRWASKEKCRHGHDLSPENIYTDSNGSKGCRICKNERNTSWRSRQKCRTQSTLQF